ncbi:site-specific integrase [Metabacillus litoralis]|uniref:site-specific integrase n=1 Tax=Metabacillus litoralis TaxID=152268 RepID=UPI0027D88AE6|nr:site-specific integrase [Metabacillus litoralis]
MLGEGLVYYLILLGLASGARFGELVGLTQKDFDFKNNTITINKTWGYAKRHPQGFGPTKNEASNRTIKLDNKTMNAFRNLFETVPPNLYGLVFYTQESKYRVISNTNANNLLQKTLQELDIDLITMHGIRHTHASVLLYRKVDINYVSERLGHSNIETTYKHYSHVLKELREEEEKKTVETFENM